MDKRFCCILSQIPTYAGDLRELEVGISDYCVDMLLELKFGVKSNTQVTNCADCSDLSSSQLERC